MSKKYTAEEIKAGLAELEPEIPWTHHFDFGHGIETVKREEGKSYRKSIGLGKLNSVISKLIERHTIKGDIAGLRVFDIASAEGGHSIAMAQQGADVLGIEGRELYVKRAQFAAKVLACENASFILGDVRDIAHDDIGTFDVVLCSGILHHLNPEAFEKFMADLYQYTRDCLIIYTHISNTESIQQFRLKGPVKTTSGYTGYLFREHKENTSIVEKIKRVRASLNNDLSFWATRESLTNCLEDVGFSSVCEILKPHIFSNPAKMAFRPLIVARK